MVITGESLAGRSGRERRLFRQPARLGSVAQEVADVLTHKDYKVIVPDYDIPFAAIKTLPASTIRRSASGASSPPPGPIAGF
jgi:hypothetical protein